MEKIIVALIMALLAAPLQASELQVGQWQGKVTMPGKEPAQAVFRVRPKKAGDDKAYKIDMFYIERPYRFQGLTIPENELRFSINTGDEYDCILWLEDDAKSELDECHEKQGYCGQCLHKVDGEVRKIIINMARPPETP